MRYLLHAEQLQELSARQEYLYDITKLYFLPGPPEGSYIPLHPVGMIGPDILFITGHTDQVEKHLDEWINRIPEKTLVITSCFGNTFKRFAGKKILYVPPSKSICTIRKGAPFGFGFNISDVELDFYNAKGNIKERVRSAYTRLR